MQTTLQQWSEQAREISEVDRALIVASAETRWNGGVSDSADAARNRGAAGRGNVSHVELADGTRVIVREFLRGGLLARFCRRSFLRPQFGSRQQLPDGSLLSGYRPFDELRVLEYLRLHGTSVPVPVVAFICESYLTYRGLIVLEEVRRSRNLLDLVLKKEQGVSLAELSAAVGREAWKMLNLGIQHTDLHLGNVLLDGTGGVVIIDLDKALCLKSSSDLSSARAMLIERWTRSCKKHGALELIKPFSEAMLDG